MVRRSARTRKVTVTVPADLLEAASARVTTGRASSLSAYLSEALEKQVVADEQGDRFLALLEELDVELGPPSAEDYAWARRFASQ